MLLVGYCFGVRSERRLCEEVQLNLAYRWFCRLGLDGDVPGHSTFSKNRHGRFRDSDLQRRLFETVVRRCMAEGLVGGDGFAVDACQLLCPGSVPRAGAGASTDLYANSAVIVFSCCTLPATVYCSSAVGLSRLIRFGCRSGGLELVQGEA
jgi:IS5 family transposase